MPDDDWALGQNEVDVRNEARRDHMRTDIWVCADPEADWIRGPHHDEQASFCTGDTHCQAAADEHDLDCPVEQQLHQDFGF